ncbi:uncharacterized protein [Nicotiana sylvestris]|uniref:uncharacterized protein n=1 Tax=Nicotiana sylvestris TaxID=4096 RepID=UPI00388C4126
MKDVDKKEIIKLLDARVVYPISDSSWTSLVQCVPKKRGMMVATNDKNELIPTRTVTGWRVLLLQEFDIDIQDMKGCENQVADHLSNLKEEGRLHDGLEINDSFPDEQLLAISMKEVPRFVDLANCFVCGIIPDEFSSSQRKKLKRNCQDYYWDESYLFWICMDGVIRKCILEEEKSEILRACHSSPYGGHHGGARMVVKVLSCGFNYPTLYKDARDKEYLVQNSNVNQMDWSEKLDDALRTYQIA